MYTYFYIYRFIKGYLITFFYTIFHYYHCYGFVSASHIISSKRQLFAYLKRLISITEILLPKIEFLCKTFLRRVQRQNICNEIIMPHYDYEKKIYKSDYYYYYYLFRSGLAFEKKIRLMLFTIKTLNNFCVCRYLE